MPSYPHKFQLGDTVIIRTWDDMLSQYGSLGEHLWIKTPYVAFRNSMKQCCGRSFKVKWVLSSIDDEYWIYILGGDGSRYLFTEDMFVFTPSVPAFTISFDDLMKGVT